MYGRTLNYNQLSAAVKKLTDWYEANGVLGQVGAGLGGSSPVGWLTGHFVGAGGGRQQQHHVVRWAAAHAAQLQVLPAWRA